MPSWPPTKLNVVFDANAVVSAALKAESVPEQALLLARQHCQIWLSQRVDDEIREVLDRWKFRNSISLNRKQYILGLLTESVRFVEPSERVAYCRDPDDDMYLELALAAAAAFLISGDMDLLVLDPWRGVRIMSPAEFVRLWTQASA